MSENPKLFWQEERFDRLGDNGDAIFSPGALSTEITLRDLFIAFAPPAPNEFLYRCKDGDIDETAVQREVRWRRDYADALLADRSGK